MFACRFTEPRREELKCEIIDHLNGHDRLEYIMAITSSPHIKKLCKLLLVYKKSKLSLFLVEKTLAGGPTPKKKRKFILTKHSQPPFLTRKGKSRQDRCNIVSTEPS